MASSDEKPKITVTSFEHGWTSGNVTYKRKSYHFNMKNFIEKSKYGINKGCISKLLIIDNANHKLLVNYDRGWDVKPNSENVKKVYRALLRRFNGSMPAEYVSRWMDGWN